MNSGLYLWPIDIANLLLDKNRMKKTYSPPQAMRQQQTNEVHRIRGFDCHNCGSQTMNVRGAVSPVEFAFELEVPVLLESGAKAKIVKDDVFRYNLIV